MPIFTAHSFNDAMSLGAPSRISITLLLVAASFIEYFSFVVLIVVHGEDDDDGINFLLDDDACNEGKIVFV